MSKVGYNYCACQCCFELYVGEPGEMCDDCDVAGCDVDGDCEADWSCE